MWAAHLESLMLLGVSGLLTVTSVGLSAPSTRGAQSALSNWPAGASSCNFSSASQASREQRSSFCTQGSLKPNGGGKSSTLLSGEASLANDGRGSANSLRTEPPFSSGHFPAR